MKSWLVAIALALGLWILDSKNIVVDSFKKPFSKQIFKSKAKVLNLDEQVSRLLVDGEMALVKQENERLRELLQAPLSASWQIIPVELVDQTEEKLKLIGGREAGIKVGDQVIIAAKNIKTGVLVARVVKVGDYLSEADLITRKNTILMVTIAGKQGVVVGSGTDLQLTQVEQKNLLVNGEVILTTGGDGWLPGLTVGQVGEVFGDDAAVYQTAQVVKDWGETLADSLAIVSLAFED